MNRWFASLPIMMVGSASLMLGTFVSSTEEAGWSAWGHEGSIVMVVPIVIWVVLNR